MLKKLPDHFNNLCFVVLFHPPQVGGAKKMYLGGKGNKNVACWGRDFYYYLLLFYI